MSTGIEFFNNGRFQEASEYFIEVIRLVCEIKFVREAHVYQAKCNVKLVRSTVAINREVKHDVYGKRQTANGKNNSDFAHFFFST